MSKPLISDSALVKEIDRLFSIDYSSANSSKAVEPTIEDPRSIYPPDSQLDSIQEQRQRSKSK